jgi:peptide/nickel transport system substrate-binding protein
MRKRRFFAIAALGLIVAGCAGGGGTASDSRGSQSSAVSAGLKTLRFGVIARNWPKDGIVNFSGIATISNNEDKFVFHAGLTTYDADSRVLPRIAQKVPHVSDGDWKVFPDGQMEVTWRLRPNVKWHDGTPATADDFAFGLQVVQDPDSPLFRSEWAQLISEIRVVDPSTFVARWKETFIYANVSGPSDIPALPRHLMAPVYDAGDKPGFFNSPLWGSNFVGLGPYRLTEWQEGSRIEGVAFDDYFLGRPKIDRVTYQYFGEANGVMLSLLSDAADMTPMGSLEIPILLLVKNAWEPSQAGTTFVQAARTRTYSFQFRNPDAPWARDVRVRRALAHMLDRPALVEALMGGMVSVADTLVPPNDPAYRLLEQRGLNKYEFDLNGAERLMGEAGWTRTPGSSFRSAAGEPFPFFDITYSDGATNTQEAEALAGQWKTAGIEVALSPVSQIAPTAVRDEGRHSSKGVAAFPRGGPDLQSVAEYTSAEIGTSANRFRTANRGGYSNPAYDRLYGQARIALEEGPRQALIADMLKILSDDVALITGFYDSSTATSAFRKGIRGPAMPSALQPPIAWNINEWDID